MPDDRNQLLLPGGSSQSAESYCNITHDGQTTVRVEDPGGSLGQASLQSDGCFRYDPVAGRTLTSTRCSAWFDWSFGRRSYRIEVPGSELIGAQLEGTSAFRIWYCTQRTFSGGRCKRSLCKTAAFRCATSQEAGAFVSAVQARAARAASDARPRQLVVILNPVSGPGSAQKHYEQTVRPVLDAAGLQHTLHVTAGAGHASDIAANLDLKEVDALLFMGGDGTVHEALQGLMGRPDWKAAAAIPFALLPAGSGNALAANTGMWDLHTALYAVIKGKQAPIDVISILQPPHARRFAFLSVTFGLIANLDIGTEHLRWMGGARFTVGALHQILFRCTHKLRLAFLPATTAASQDVESGSSQPKENDEQHIGPAIPQLQQLGVHSTPWSAIQFPEDWKDNGEMTVQLFAACNLPYLDMTYHLAPRAGLSTGALDVMTTIGKASRIQGLQFMIKSEKGEHLGMPLVSYQQASAMVMEPVSDETWMVVDGEEVPFTRLYAEVHPGLCRVLVA